MAHFKMVAFYLIIVFAATARSTTYFYGKTNYKSYLVEVFNRERSTVDASNMVALSYDASLETEVANRLNSLTVCGVSDASGATFDFAIHIIQNSPTQIWDQVSPVTVGVFDAKQWTMSSGTSIGLTVECYQTTNKAKCLFYRRVLYSGYRKFACGRKNCETGTGSGRVYHATGLCAFSPKAPRFTEPFTYFTMGTQCSNCPTGYSGCNSMKLCVEEQTTTTATTESPTPTPTPTTIETTAIETTAITATTRKPTKAPNNSTQCPPPASCKPCVKQASGMMQTSFKLLLMGALLVAYCLDRWRE